LKKLILVAVIALMVSPVLAEPMITLPDGADAYWAINNATTQADAMIVFENSTAGNTFGLFDKSNINNKLPVFLATDVAGDTALVRILGNVQSGISLRSFDSDVPAVVGTAIFAANAFGYYLTTGQATYYSDTTLNAGNIDHMTASIITPDAEYQLGWDGLFVVNVESISPIVHTYSGGSGTAESPYQIANADDLLALRDNTGDYGKCFILTADINLDSNLPGGQVFTTAIIAPDTSSSYGFQGTAFTGTFDGNGHKITNFTINGGSNQYLGLFGQINSSVSVKNLSLENFAVVGINYYVGGLVGYNNGSISNCYSAGQVSGVVYVGGLVGENGGSISNCYSTCVVSGPSGSEYVGGLAGCNLGSISNCYSAGQVSGSQDVGGLVGGNWEGSISNCSSTCVVSGLSGSNSIGGLVGINLGSINNCYSTGAVSGSSDVGGLVGYNDQNSISNCYSTGTVSGSNSVGGLVGVNFYGNTSNCYSTGIVSGSSRVGGLVGYNYDGVSGSFWDIQVSGQTIGVGGGSSAGVSSKTTSQMKTLSTFTSAGWDFLNVWVIDSGHTYPYLLTVTGGGRGTRFLIFPIKGVSLNDANISSVFDHSMTASMMPDSNRITAYTGEIGITKATNAEEPIAIDNNGAKTLYSYWKSDRSRFWTTGIGHYVGGDNRNPAILSYEGHNGYDYPYPITKEVIAAADGIVHIGDHNNIDSYNTVWIDHQNHYASFYLHMRPSDVNVKEGQKITQGSKIGKVGDYYNGNGGIGSHLHFTVKYYSDGVITRSGGRQVDPYGWNKKPEEDPYYLRFGVHNEPLWKAPSPVTVAAPTNPNVGQKPTGLSGHLNYWDVAQNKWVPMTAVPSTSVFDQVRPTIVITHGWNDSISNTPDGSGSDNWTMRMAKQEEAIANQNVNVLAWDWQAQANPAGIPVYFQWPFFYMMPQDAAESARNGNVDGGNLAWELRLIGINPAQTQLIGHSNGGDLMGSAATTIFKLMGSKIERLTTLDTPNVTIIGVNATQFIQPQNVNEVEVYYSGDRFVGGAGATVTWSNVFNGEVYPTGFPEHSYVPDWYTNLGETATIPHAPDPNVRGMNWSIVSWNRPSTWIAQDRTEQGANTGVFDTASILEQVKLAQQYTTKQMNFYQGEEYQGTHAATITDLVRSFVANLWGNSDGYLFKTITIPANATVMTFDMKVVTVVNGDYITLSFGDKVLFCEDITGVDSNFVTTLPIPIPDIAGLTDTLLFTLHHDANTPGSSVLLDNITFSAIRPLADLNNDLTVDFVDFAIFANKWTTQDCNESNGWCSGSDFDKSGTVDINDLAIFVGDWLWKPPKNIKADLNLSGAVNFIDFSLFANQWSNNCNSLDWCEGTDFDHSGSVDILDLAEFAKYWLSGS
jgi:murein DD-endopeptidase MepM/ murein hydrolase activator NlpD